MDNFFATGYPFQRHENLFGKAIFRKNRTARPSRPHQRMTVAVSIANRQRKLKLKSHRPSARSIDGGDNSACVSADRGRSVARRRLPWISAGGCTGSRSQPLCLHIAVGARKRPALKVICTPSVPDRRALQNLCCWAVAPRSMADRGIEASRFGVAAQRVRVIFHPQKSTVRPGAKSRKDFIDMSFPFGESHAATTTGEPFGSPKLLPSTNPSTKNTTAI